MSLSRSTSVMEEKHIQILQNNRKRFIQLIDVERLYPMLRETRVLTPGDINQIEQLGSAQQKVVCLLDMLPSKGSSAFQSLCLALETTYPHLLTVMFLGSISLFSWNSHGSVRKGSSQSTVSSGTSESDFEDLRSSVGPRLMFPRTPTNGPTDMETLFSQTYVQPELYENTKSAIDVLDDKHLSNRNYDQLRRDCHSAIMELESLKAVHSETIKKCEQALKQQQLASSSEQQMRAELGRKKEELHQVVLDKDRLCKDVEELQHVHEEDTKELNKLWRQNGECLQPTSSSEMLQKKMYDTALDKMELVKKDYNTLKMRYDDLVSKNNATIAKLERIQGEVWQKENESTLKAECNSLQQQVARLQRDFQLAHHDKETAIKREKMLQKEYENKIKYILSQKHETDIKLHRTEEQRRAAVEEYSMVMSERDDVHKEMDKLQSDAHVEANKRKEFEQKYHNLLIENDSLKYNLQNAHQERDIALVDVDDLGKQYQDMLNNTMMAQKERDKALKEFEKFKDERDVARRERQEALVERDQLRRKCYDAELQQRTMNDEFNMANRDVEQLRRQVEALEKELKETQQEIESAKQQRNFAFAERDKIIQERDSIKVHRDQLRKDRDCAVSRLAESLQETDFMLKQRNEATKDLKDAREKMQDQSEREARMRQLIAQHSQDSAIDADSQDWETDCVELEGEFAVEHTCSISALGIDISDNPDRTFFPDECSIYVTKVDKGSIADGRLRVYDCVLRVNEIDLTHANRDNAIQTFQSCQFPLHMVIKRRRSHGSRLVPVKLYLSQKDPGVVMESGVFINRVSSGSQSLREGGFIPGDRIVMVNNTPMDNKSVREVESLLDSCQDPVSVTVMRLSSSCMSRLQNSASPTVDSFKSQDTSSSKSSLSALLSACEEGETKTDKSVFNNRMWKEISVQTDIPLERGMERNDSFVGSNHSRESSHESTATQGTLKGNEWEEMKANYQYSSQKSQGETAKESETYWDERTSDVNTELISFQASQNNYQSPPFVRDGSMRVTAHRKDNVCRSKRDRSFLADERNHRKSYSRDGKEDAQEMYSYNDHNHSSSAKENIAKPGGHFSPELKFVEYKTEPREVGRRSPRKDRSSKIDYNKTWPKSSRPPGVYVENREKRKRETTIPLISPPAAEHHSISREEQNSVPEPRNRKSSFVHRKEDSSSSLSSSCSSPIPAKVHMAVSKWAKEPDGFVQIGDASVVVTSVNVVPNQRWSQEISPRRSGSHSSRPMSMPPIGRGELFFPEVQFRKENHRHRRPIHNPLTRFPPPNHFPFRNSSSASYDGMADWPMYPQMLTGSPITPLQTQVVRSKHPVPQYVATSIPISPHHEREKSNASNEDLHPLSNTLPKNNMSRHSRMSLPGTNNQVQSRRHHRNQGSASFMQSDPGALQYICNRDYNTLPSRRPGNKDTRIHIPGVKRVSNISADQSSISSIHSGRSSPNSPSIPEEFSDTDYSQLSSMSETEVVVTRLEKGTWADPRLIKIEKSIGMGIGFTIIEGKAGGIFVHTVEKESLAEAGGMRYGDKILEFNAINLRKAKKDQATSVLSCQANQGITILVQYKPNEMNDQIDTVYSSQTGTPASTPCSSRTTSPVPTQSRPTSEIVSDAGTITPPTPRASRIYVNLPVDTMNFEDPRKIYLTKDESSLGFNIIGGNKVGIFVSEIKQDSVADRKDGLRIGDQLLEYNGVDLRLATAEQATLELQKPTQEVSMLVQYKYSKFSVIQKKGLSGDAVYIKTLIEFPGDADQMSFSKEDILLIDNTLPSNQIGMWSACQLIKEEDFRKGEHGHIPNKSTLEQELARKRTISEGLQEEELRSSRRSSAGNRRSSFFRRKKHHRSNSKDSRDFSEGSMSDVPIQDEAVIPTYQRVERLDTRIKRPVVLLGPLTDKVASKLMDESPDKYSRVSENKRASIQDGDKEMADNVYLECQKKDGFYECIPTQAVKIMCEQGIHCLLDDVPPTICERLQRVHLYPIVLFIRFKSSKQIREQRDPHFLPEKVSNKLAKEMYESAQKLEQEFKSFFTDTVQGGNLASICTRIKKIIDKEQTRVIWVPSNLPL